MIRHLSHRAILPGALSLLVAGTFAADAASKAYKLTPAWSIAPTTPYEWVTTTNHHRGLAYNPASGDLITLSRYPAPAGAYVLNSTNGTVKGTLNTNGVKHDMGFPLNMVGVADDGAIYACNLAVDSTVATPAGNNGPFRIYRWQNASAAPQLVYEGDPSLSDPVPAGRRFGDTFAVRGAGASTEILCGNRSTNGLALFRTTDGINFSAALRMFAAEFTNSTLAGISFGPTNSFYLKGDSGADAGKTPLLHFTYDESGVVTQVKSHELFKFAGGPFAYDPVSGYLVMVKTLTTLADVPHEVRIYRDTIGGFVQQDHPTESRSFPAMYPNGNGTGAAAIGGGRIFALASNNGIVAYDIYETEVTPQLFWTEDGGWTGPGLGVLWSAAFDGDGKTPVAAGLNRPIGIDLDYANRRVYWAEDGFDTFPSRIMRANFDGTDVTEVFNGATHGFANAQMLKLDVANNHVYWTTWADGVMRGNLDGSGFTILGGNAAGFRYTALDLDLVNKRIYYGDPMQGGGVLFRMDFDGGNNIEVARPIAGGEFYFNTMRLDVANGFIYWPDGGTHQIKRMGLDGSNVAVLAEETDLYPLDIAFAPNGRMYWTGPGTLRIGSANKDGTDVKSKVVAASGTAFAIAAVPVLPPAPSRLSIGVSGNTVTISWTGGQGPFQLQRRSSLTSGTWQNVGAQVSGNQTTDTFSAGGMFYRVVGN